MASRTVTDIESKTQATKYLSFKSLVVFFAYMIISYMLMDYVNAVLHIPYLIFSGVCCVILLLPSAYNQTRNNFESIFLILKGDKGTYPPVYVEDLKGDRINELISSGKAKKTKATKEKK